MNETDCEFAVFESALGWMALGFCDERVARLSFGHRSRRAAFQSAGTARTIEPRGERGSIVERLQAYANGARDDFLDVPIVHPSHTPFQVVVVSACRAIPYGETRSYGDLAAIADRPGAARAVGTVMSTNTIPLIVPCHRVVGAHGALGGYSAPDGLAMKRRLLALESENV